MTATVRSGRSRVEVGSFRPAHGNWGGPEASLHASGPASGSGSRLGGRAAGLLAGLLLLAAPSSLGGATAADAKAGSARPSKADLWEGRPQFAKVSNRLLQARRLAGLGLDGRQVSDRVPMVLVADGLAEVEVRLTRAGAPVVERLAAAGLEVTAAYPRYGRVLGRCRLDRLEELAALPEVATIHPLYGPRRAAGSVTSQGDASIDADDARLAFGVDGTGIDVGILSDSFHATLGGSTTAAVCSTPGGDLPVAILTGSSPQVSGDLPPAVTVLDNCDAGGFCASGGSDEGAALAETLIDLAPAAGVFFHTAFRSEADFAEGISELVACGVDVLVDDVIWPAEPMFQDGIVAQEVQAAVDGGVAYFSASGNRAAAGLDATFADSDTGVDNTDFPTTGVDLHDFGSGDRFAAVTVPAGCGVNLVLQWNQPFSGTLGPGAANDLDLYLCRSDAGTQGPDGRLLDCDPFDNVNGALAASTDSQGCTASSGDPFEIVSFSNAGAGPATGYLAVDHYCGSQSDVRFRVVAFASPGCSLSTGYGFESAIFGGPTVYGHAAAAGARSVAAVFYGEIDSGGSFEQPPGRIDVSPSSSLGGDLPFYFDGAGDPLAGAPVLRFKPDLAAPEGTNTTFFGVDIDYDPDSFPNFFGTSAAVPHAAAVAALMLDRYPALTPAELYLVLDATATDIGAAGIDPLSGSGLVDAHAALVQMPYSQLATSADTLDFGSVEVGSVSTLELVLSSTGTADLHVTDIASSDPAVFTPSAGGSDPCPGLTPTIADGDSCTIEVTFGPNAVSHDETLTLQSDSAVDPIRLVTLTGSGFTSCESGDHRVLPEPAMPVDGSLTEEACVSLTAGPYAIGPSGDVSFTAGEAIKLLNGFSVAGAFTAVIDPLLVPPSP